MRRNDYNWSSRIERSFTQRIYLMDAEMVGDNSFRFKMMGNSGNPYDILVKNGELISCSCPDHQLWTNFCKHMMHLLIRVIGIPRQQVFNHYYRDGNFTVGCETILIVVDWFNRRESETHDVGEYDVEVDGQSKMKMRPIEDEDDCGVCYEPFGETKEEPTIWCRTGCGKSVHQSCFLKWSQALRKKYGSHKSVGCVYCRTDWVWG